MFVMHNPVLFIDPTGLWGQYVHETLTIRWLKELGVPEALATIIGVANYAVDDLLTIGGFGPLPWQAPGRHFDRRGSYGINLDTRLFHYNRHFNNAVTIAQDAMTVFNHAQYLASFSGDRQRFMNDAVAVFNMQMERALIELGTGWHSLQDIHAHGVMGRGFLIASHLPNQLGGRADNINYSWAPASRGWLIGQRQGQLVYDPERTRLNQTRAATEESFSRFLDAIGGMDNLWRNPF